METAAATLTQRVEAALDSIRGYLQTDGGDVRLVQVIDNQVAEIELLGACSTCHMSPMTMKAGVEEAIRRAVPEITEVRTTGIVV